jgi:hypothetical protein
MFTVMLNVTSLNSSNLYQAMFYKKQDSVSLLGDFIIIITIDQQLDEIKTCGLLE